MVIKDSKIEKFIRRYINVYSSVALDEDKWLTKREKDFIVECVILQSQNVDLGSAEAVEYITNKLGLNERNVYLYRTTLKKKEWILPTQEGLTLPPAFDFSKSPIPKKFNFNFALEYEKEMEGGY